MHQVNLPQEQRETVCSLEVDCDQVSPVGPCEVEWVYDVNGYTWSLGGMETPGFLIVTRIPDVNVRVCVVKCMSGASVLKRASGVSNMACVSACMELVLGPIQMGDLNGELNRPQRVNLATAPGSRDGAYEAHGAFRVRPACVHLRDRNPARERSTSDTSRPRGRRECRWRVLYEFGTDGSTCGRVCEAPCAARRVFCSQNDRSGFPGRCARAGFHGKPRRFGARVTSLGISQRELRASGACWLAWRTPRRRALVAMHRATTRPQVSANGTGRACCKLPPWRCKVRGALPRVHDSPARIW